MSMMPAGKFLALLSDSGVIEQLLVVIPETRKQRAILSTTNMALVL